MTQPLYYRISDTLKLLSISKATLYRMVKRGELELIHIGCASRISADSINAMIASSRQEATGYHRAVQNGERVKLAHAQ